MWDAQDMRKGDLPFGRWLVSQSMWDNWSISPSDGGIEAESNNLHGIRREQFNCLLEPGW